jgi:hypothetical protein
MALVLMETQIRSWVAMQAPEMIFVHAGVVTREGRAIVMPGDSFAGKTTLVEALVRRGADYFSDEFAVFDQQGLVHPYPKALSMRSRDARTEVQTPVETIGGRAGDVAAPLELVIVTYYAPGGDWQPRKLSPGEGALALLSRTVSARNRPEESLRVLTAAIKGATVLEGERDEADAFAELLLSGAVAA